VTNAAQSTIGSILLKRSSHSSGGFLFRGSGRLVGMSGHPGRCPSFLNIGHRSMLCMSRSSLPHGQPTVAGCRPGWNALCDPVSGQSQWRWSPRRRRATCRGCSSSLPDEAGGRQGGVSGCSARLELRAATTVEHPGWVPDGPHPFGSPIVSPGGASPFWRRDVRGLLWHLTCLPAHFSWG
jgi:hypothetical protein